MGESTLCLIVCLTLLYLYNLAAKYITCIEILDLVAVLVKLLSIMRLCLDQQSFHHTWCRKEYHEWEHQDGRALHPHYFAFLQPPPPHLLSQSSVSRSTPFALSPVSEACTWQTWVLRRRWCWSLWLRLAAPQPPLPPPSRYVALLTAPRRPLPPPPRIYFLQRDLLNYNTVTENQTYTRGQREYHMGYYCVKVPVTKKYHGKYNSSTRAVLLLEDDSQRKVTHNNLKVPEVG